VGRYTDPVSSLVKICTLWLPQVTDCLPLSHWYKYLVTECDRSDMSPDWGEL
jgi:hypothetical protein